ncbi:hypothetical protein BJX64DRAFT_121682 [Aspergillus heterothallicus]
MKRLESGGTSLIFLPHMQRQCYIIPEDESPLSSSGRSLLAYQRYSSQCSMITYYLPRSRSSIITPVSLQFLGLWRPVVAVLEPDFSSTCHDLYSLHIHFFPFCMTMIPRLACFSVASYSPSNPLFPIFPRVCLRACVCALRLRRLLCLCLRLRCY